MATINNKLNKNDVQNGILRFVLSFVLLTAVSFLCIFLFFKSSEAQKKYVQKELDDYKQMIVKSEQLESKFNEVYNNMLLLSNNKVSNDIYLSNKIVEDLRDCRNVIGNDSVQTFKQYTIFIKHIEKDMMPLKNELISINIKEQAAERKLYECTGKIKKVKENRVPPLVRNFQ